MMCKNQAMAVQTEEKHCNFFTRDLQGRRVIKNRIRHIEKRIVVVCVEKFFKLRSRHGVLHSYIKKQNFSEHLKITCTCGVFSLIVSLRVTINC